MSRPDDALSEVFGECCGCGGGISVNGTPRSRRATLPVRVQGGGGVGLGIEGGWDGLHTVELVPTFAKG